MRIFVAVWPPPAVVVQLATIERPLRAGIRWTTENQWHVTLRFLGSLDPDAVEGGKAALLPLGSPGRIRPATAVAGPAVTRLGPSVLCVPVAGLDELAAAVNQLTAGIGGPVDPRPFRGHLTIARTRGSDGRVPDSFPFSASWPVADVTLVASDRHPSGARYRVISRVDLPAGPLRSVRTRPGT